MSCECICSYVQLIHSIYQSFFSSSLEHKGQQDTIQNKESLYHYKLNKRRYSLNNSSYKNTQNTGIIQTSSKKFFEKFCLWLKSMSNDEQQSDLDFAIKRLSVELFHANNCSFLTGNTLYATIYFSLNQIAKSGSYFIDSEDNLEYFKSRIIPYNTSLNQNSPEFDQLNEWLENVFMLLAEYKTSRPIFSSHLVRQLKFISRQIDCDFNCKTSTDSSKIICIKSYSPGKAAEVELVQRLLQSTWIYLVDVLTGYILNTKLDSLEEILFFKQNKLGHEQFDISNDMITDISFKLVAFKSCLDSLHRIQCILSNLKSMDRELSQLFLIMGSDWFSSPKHLGEELSKTISLNQLVCFDFMLYSASRIVCDLNGRNSQIKSLEKSQFTANNHAIVWKNLIEVYFAVT